MKAAFHGGFLQESVRKRLDSTGRLQGPAMRI